MPVCMDVYIYIYICICVYTSDGLSLDSDSVSGQSRSAIGPKVDGQHVLFMFCFIYIIDRWSIVKLTGLCGRS